MSNQFEQIKRDIMSAMRSNKPRTSAYDTTAEVLYVDGETAWVRIPGGAPETPVDLSVAAKQGDIVQVRVANGRAWINGNNTAPPTDDTVANAAHVVATATHEAVEELEEHFWYDGNGAHVEGESYRNDMRSDGLHIVEKSTGETVAKFGADGSQIGKDGEAHVNMDYHSLSMTDKDGNVFFDVEDGRNQDGIAEASYEFTATGTTGYPIEGYNVTAITSVTIDGVAVSASQYQLVQQQNVFYIVFNSAVTAGSVVEVVFQTISPAYAYTLGTRANGQVGRYSATQGTNNKASGVSALARGEGSNAKGVRSVASGYYAESNANASHALGHGTRTKAVGQMAVGRYNEDSTAHALEVGAGTAQTRKTVAGITWDGDYEFQADGDLLTALTAKGWNVAGTGGLVSLKKILTEIINAL